MSSRPLVSSVVVLAALGALASACDNKDKPSTPAVTPSASPSGTGSANVATPKESTAASASASAATAPADAAAPGAHAPASAAVTWKEGLATPESVLYDDANDVYLVSNINGQPLEADNNGFIAKLTPDGKVQTLKWIEGGKNKVTLNAPKGMVFANDLLYVADLDMVRMFDRKTGAPAGEVKLPGATFMNDLFAMPDGKVLASDSGLKAGAKGFDPSGSDAVYSIDKAKKATPLAKGKELGAPNGLVAVGDKIWVVTFGTGELYSLDGKGKRADAQKLPKGSLDGILALPGGDLLVSSWEANAVFRGKPGGEWREVLTDVKSPADIGWDTKRSRVLVPLFMENEVRAYDIK